MNQFVFFDGKERESLLPLTYLRPCCHCQVGMRTIEEKWKSLLPGQFDYLTPSYLQSLYNSQEEHFSAEQILINGAALPNQAAVSAMHNLSTATVLMNKGSVIAFIGKKSDFPSLQHIYEYAKTLSPVEVEVQVIRYPEDILRLSRDEFLKDYNQSVEKRRSNPLHNSNKLRGEDLFIGTNVTAFDAIFNTLDGPIYIDDDAEIMENAVLKGPIYVGPYSKIHVGAKVYAETMLGPHCKIGGEIKRTTMFGYSNKAHDGFLGDSILGKWCNLGADTNNSNMKNTYGNVSLWDIEEKKYRVTERQFMGMILGDHTMSAINTSFNTGSVTGIFTNILDRTPDRFTPSFSWGKNHKYLVDKAIEVAKTVMRRRGINMPEEYEKVIRFLAD